MRGLLLLIPAVTACTDYDTEGCRARAGIRGFCEDSWGSQMCCATCSAKTFVAEPTGCKVPKQKCATWSCNGRQQVGSTCQVAAKTDARCQRCSLVDSESCTPFVQTSRTCLADGSWSGIEPACRSYCDKKYVAPEEHIVSVEASEGLLESTAPEAIKVVDITAAPHGDFLKKKQVNKYMGKRIDVFGHWMVLFTNQCETKWGDGPALGVANQYAQWVDWQGTGQPNNPKVWANLLANNVTMVMFKEDGSSAMDKFFDKYPFDEDPYPDHHWFHPHDVGCDETPHADAGDKNTFDNAYCEVVQQIFNMGYRAAYPDVFFDKKGSKVGNAMDKNIGNCGHAYDHTFKYPKCTGKYHYDDKTCDYACLLSEYEYWSLTSLLGGQDGHLLPPKNRCDDISDEWESCTKEKLAKNDPDITAIMTDPQYGLPTKLAYGNYKPQAAKVLV